MYNVQFKNLRLLATAHQKVDKTTLKKEKAMLGTYIVQRYMEYVQNYTKVLEKRFPAAISMYRVFSIGISDFYKDLKVYIKLRIKVLKDKGFDAFTRRDIELYHKMPEDMWRIAPVLFLSAIPFGNYLIFPLALLRPRKLLCSHFWSIQQRSEFLALDMKERLKHNRPIFRQLQSKLDSIHYDSPIKDKWVRIVAQLGSGLSPSVSDILECKSLFIDKPYSLNKISYAHSGHLLKLYGMKKGIFRASKLKFHAFKLLMMDRAILKEGGVNELSLENLQYACFLRGLYGAHLTKQEMAAWLQQWLDISMNVNKNSYSLILHCPILLAYNHPQNWVLIYDQKKP